MERLRTVCLLTTITVGLLSARTNPLMEPAEVVDTQQAILPSGGLLELKDSVGDVEIVGWDQPEMEVVVTKTSQRRYAPEEMDRAVAALDLVVISTEQLANDHVVIRTGFPSRAAMRPLHGKSNVHLSYRINVPRQTRLVVTQETGELKVHNVTASMMLRNRIGDIQLDLPDDQDYAVDAKARIGEVSSEWCCQLESAGGSVAPHRLQLRVGIGDITVRKSRTPVEVLVD